ncbi:MAG: class I SAM-dependent methyltransferase [Chitinophagales bacterium]|nr:class I SAM-dependent methyltransferase [Chitinophagales bacterium]
MTNRSIRWGIAQKAEINWWKRYLATKPVGEYLQWKKNYWLDFLDKLGFSLNDLSGKKILEVGCGPAGIFTILTESDVTAIDPLLENYSSKIHHFNPSEYPNVNFQNGSIEEYIESRSFDLVFCINVINHVRDIKGSIRNIRKVLDPGGELVISIDAHNYSILKHLFRLTQLDILHPHQFDIDEYQKMLHGFETSKVECLKDRFIFNYYALRCKRVTS